MKSQSNWKFTKCYHIEKQKNSLENLHTYLNINLFYVPGDIWGMQTHEIFPMCNVKFPENT